MIRLLLFFVITINLFANEKVSLQLKWFHQFQFAGYYAAKEKGFYSDVGLDVEIKQRDLNKNYIEQVISGESQYGISDSALLTYRAKNKPVVIVAPILQHSPTALITLKTSGIDTPFKLKDKNVMFYKRQIDGLGILAMLNSLNIEANVSKIKNTISYNSLIEGKTDAYSVYLTNEPFYFKEKGVDINIINPTNYGFDLYGDMLFTSESEIKNNPSRVIRFKEASLKGWRYALENKDEIISLIREKYNSSKSVKHLKYEADALEQLIQQKSIPLGTLDEGRIEYTINIYKKYGLIDKDDILSDYFFKYDENELALFNQQKEKELQEKVSNYLKDKKVIKMCIDPEWMPFEKNEGGKHIGMSADYMSIIQESISIPIKMEVTKSWTESLSFGEQRKCDIFSLIMPTKKRKEYLKFTKPYLKVPLVVVTNSHELFIDDITKVTKKLGIVKNYAYAEILRNKYPNMHLVDVENVKDGLDKVHSGKLFGLIGTLATTGYEIQRNYVGNLKIAGKFDESWDLGIAVRDDEPLLKYIFDNAIEKITQTQQQAILNKWVSVKFDEKSDPLTILKYIFLTFLISSVIIYFILNKNRKLKDEINNRKTIEKELEDTLELFNLGETMLFKWKNNDAWSIEYVSKNTSKILGYDDALFMSEEIKYGSLVHKDDIKTVMSEVESSLEKDAFEHKPYRVKKSDESYIWVIDKTKVIKNDKGEVTHFLGYIRDITHEIQQQEDLEISNNNLIKSEKLAALGQLLANIAHEINSPLGAINSSAQSNADELSYFVINYAKVLDSLTVQQKVIFLEIVEHIVQNNEFISTTKERSIKKDVMNILNETGLQNTRIVADKLTRLRIYKKKDIDRILPLLIMEFSNDTLNTLLVISKLFSNNHNIKEAIRASTKTILALKSYAHSADDTTSVSSKTLKETVDTVLTIYNNKIKYKVDLDYEYEELEAIQANHDELMQIWTNIIHNALYAMDNKGKLKIRIYKSNMDQVVEFQDSGCGMDEELLEKIFEPFFTTKPTGVGSGLGLDIIQNIVHKHNGDIKVSSTLGVGTTFKVIIPQIHHNFHI